MSTTRLQLQTAIYEILQKEATAYGLLTPTKVNNTIQDSLDWIASTMIGANAMWLTKQVYLDILAFNPYISLPTDLAIINFVKKRSANDPRTFVELPFKETNKETINLDPILTGQSNADSYLFANGMMLLQPHPLDDVKSVSAFVAIQDLTYTALLTGDDGNSLAVIYANTAVAGAETVSVANNIITVGIQSGASTAIQVRTAIIASVAASALVVCTITGVGANAQITQALTRLIGGESGGIMLNYLSYPIDLAADATPISGDLQGKPFIQYAKWRSARILYQMANDGTPPWAQNEQEWYSVCMKIIGKRAAMPVIISGVQNY